ncbi:MAG TPA: tyrosine--tRNA ligase, partial [Chitinophagales bacterium]|nr:tyrosine--tRNA ligase [Chitinophagales bacterium]
GIPTATISKQELEQGLDAVLLFSDKTGFMASRGEAKRTLQGKGARVNKRVIETVDAKVFGEALINNRYLLLQKGKKDFFLVIAE